MSQGQPNTAGSTARLGQYELVQEIAGSGVAGSWVARSDDPREPGHVLLWSILRLHRHVTKNVDVAETFLRDARRAQKLRHVNVAATVETGLGDGEVFVVSEHIEGETLAGLVRAAGPEGLPPAVLLRVIIDVLEALSAAHALAPPLLHGELGPWCVVVGRDGVSRVSGFGVASALARLGTHGVKSHERLAYAAPERVKAMASGAADDAPGDARSDLFSVAIMLWEGLARQRLFASRIEAAVIQKVAAAVVPSLPAEVPPPICEIVRRALERDPRERFADAGAFVKALRSSGEGWIAPTDEVAACVASLAGASIAERAAHIASVPSAPPPAGGKLESFTIPFGRPASSLLGDLKREALAAGLTPDPAPAPVAPEATPAPPVLRVAPDRGTIPFGRAAGSLLGHMSLAEARAALDDASPSPPAARPAPAAVKSAPGAPRSAPSVPRAVSTGPVKAAPATAKSAPAVSDAPPDSMNLDWGTSEASFASVSAPVKAPRAAPVKTSPPLPRAAPVAEKAAPAVERAAPVAEKAAPADKAAPAAEKAAPAAEKAAPRKGPPPLRPPAPRSAPALPKAPIAAPAASPIAAPAASPIAAPAASAVPEAEPSGDITPVPKSDTTLPVTRPTPPKIATAARSTPGFDPSAQATLRMEMSAALIELSIGPTGGLRAGRVLDRYELLLPLGPHNDRWAARVAGAAAGKVVALRTAAAKTDGGIDLRDAFLARARVAARACHVNLAEILDYGAEDGLLYAVTSWLEGGTLDDLRSEVEGRGGVPLPIAIRIVAQVCSGLHAVHELCDDTGAPARFVHGGLRPSGVLVSGSGDVKLAEIGGLAKETRVPLIGPHRVDKAHFAPEQIAGSPPDRRTDVYAAALLLCALVARDRDVATPLPIARLVPEASPELDRVLTRALDPDPARRFDTALQLSRALGEVGAATDEEVAAFVQGALASQIADQKKQLDAATFGLDASGAVTRKAASLKPEPARVEISMAKDPPPSGEGEAFEAPIGLFGAAITDQLTNPGVDRDALFAVTPPSERRAQLVATAPHRTSVPSVRPPPVKRAMSSAMLAAVTLGLLALLAVGAMLLRAR